MDTIDRKILDLMQNSFPLEERPFDILAKELDISTEQLLYKTALLTKKGVIRRIGASFSSKNLGFTTTLIALRLSPADLDRASAFIALCPEITHSYVRKNPFNLWFTIIAQNPKKVHFLLKKLRSFLSLTKNDILNLPSITTFKLDARFLPQNTP